MVSNVKTIEKMQTHGHFSNRWNVWHVDFYFHVIKALFGTFMTYNWEFRQMACLFLFLQKLANIYLQQDRVVNSLGYKMVNFYCPESGLT